MHACIHAARRKCLGTPDIQALPLGSASSLVHAQRTGALRDRPDCVRVTGVEGPHAAEAAGSARANPQHTLLRRLNRSMRSVPRVLIAHGFDVPL